MEIGRLSSSWDVNNCCENVTGVGDDRICSGEVDDPWKKCILLLPPSRLTSSNRTAL